MTETPPDAGELKAALAKFGEDAKLWNEHKAALEKAKAGAEGLDIESLAFGPAVWVGLDARYREVQQMIIDRLGEGAREFGAIAGNLIKARDTYQREEEKNIHAIKKKW